MANEEHLAELRKGVAHWNDWVKTQSDDFRANLTRAFLSGADLREADLEGADLEGADLEGADLRRAILIGADLREANLSGAILRGADLEGAILRGADLSGADLREANLRQADLSGANVRTMVYSAVTTNDGGTAAYTNLITALNLTQNQLDEMDGDSGTILPDHLERPDHWPVVDGHLNGQRVERTGASQRTPMSQTAKVSAQISANPVAILQGSHALIGLIDAEITRLTEKNWQDDLAQEEGARQIELLKSIRATLSALTAAPPEDETAADTRNRWVDLLIGYRDKVHEILDTKKENVLATATISGIAWFSGTAGIVVPAAILAQMGGPKMLDFLKAVKGLPNEDMPKSN